MTDRRRSARLILLVVAGLAVAGTSASTPSPAPTQRVDSAGTVHLTADAPVAIQPIDIAVQSGDLTALDFTASFSQLPSAGSVLASIEAVGGTGTERRPAYGATPQPVTTSVVAQASFPFSCQRSPCDGAYVLVVTWNGAPAGVAADIPWSLSTTAEFRGSSTSATQTAGRIVVATSGAVTAPESAELGSATGGKPVHLTEADRFRTWTVAFHRPESSRPGAGRPVTLARLAAAVTQTAGAAFGAGSTKDRREEGRRDPPVQLRVFAPGDLRAVRWASEAALTIDPFVTCPATGACDTEMTVELAWADGRPGTEFDAAWTIELAAIGLTGKVEPIRATVAAVPAPHAAVASASGSFEAARPTIRGQSLFVAAVDPGLDASSPWSRVGLPARAVATVRVTSVGATPLPADALITVYGQGQQYTSGAGLGSSVELHPDQEATFAFEPTLTCPTDRPRACEVRGSIGSSFVSPSPNAAVDGIAIHVEWSIELGVAASTGRNVVIAVDPSPSSSPSR